MADIRSGLLLIVLSIGCGWAGLHFGHQLPWFLALIPLGAMCGVMGGFLLAGGMRNR